MRAANETEITSIFLVLVEEPGDYHHKPEAVFVVHSDDSEQLFCLDARYNFFQNLLRKYDREELTREGVRFRGSHVELRDHAPAQITEDLKIHDPLTTEDVVRWFYHRLPRQLWFLERHLHS